MKNSLVIAATLVAMAYPGAFHQANQDGELSAREILTRADAATMKVSTVQYNIEAVPGGITDGFVHTTRGEVRLTSGVDGVMLYQLDIRTLRPRTREPIHLSGGFDGETYFLIDHDSRQAYQDMDREVLGTGGRAFSLVRIAEFVHPAPLTDEATARQVELLDNRTIGGEECYAIKVNYDDSPDWSIWFISTSDLLPRGREQHFTIPEGEGSITATVTDLVTDPALDPATFELKVPEGYTLVDDFAP